MAGPRTRLFIGAVGLGMMPMCLQQIFYPDASLRSLLTPKAYALHAKGNPVVAAILRWCGFFWLCLSSSMVWLAAQRDGSHTTGLLGAMSVLWAFDAVGIKFWFLRRSGVVTALNWAGGGSADMTIALVFLSAYLTQGRKA